jgi:hypothetical protein
VRENAYIRVRNTFVGDLALKPRNVQIRERFNNVQAFNNLVPGVGETTYVDQLCVPFGVLP